MSVIRRAAVFGAIGTLGVFGAIGVGIARRSMRQWGATAEEVGEALPGDAAVELPMISHTHAITIAAAPEDVWPWIAQLGTGRGGWYSYEWIEKAIGLDVKSLDRVAPELQELHEGDRIPLTPDLAFPVKRVEPPSLLLLEGHDAKAGDATWVFVLREADDGATRLVTRAHTRWPGLSRTLVGLIEPGIFAMERKMLLGIKARAEALASSHLPVVGPAPVKEPASVF